jgi:osmoprotectant transport system substrate-binding protein
MNRVWAALAALLLLSGCGGKHRTTIVVGSKNFTEQWLLGEIAAQQIERKLHLKVERKLNLGGTLLTHEAILHDDIDLYPEYTGTGAGVVLKRPCLRTQPSPTWR